MTLVAGRGIEDRDSQNAPEVMVINESMARRFFSGAGGISNVVGTTIEVDAGPMKGKPAEIVGVVRDAKYRQSLTVVLIGIVAGLSLVFVATRLSSSFLYGLSPTDPIAIGLSLMLLTAVALFACYLPAQWAARVNPIVALRQD